jgi:hypothetical protein
MALSLARAPALRWVSNIRRIQRLYSLLVCNTVCEYRNIW